MAGKPWTSGPRELLLHAIGQARLPETSSHRIAFILVDNAVEIALQTYLALPARSRGGPGPPRRELDEARGSLPKLIDLATRYVPDKLDGIDFGEVEYYHTIRNTLYHQGNGISVEPDKVEAYIEIARLLLLSLFGVEVRDEGVPVPISPLALFLARWAELERLLREAELVRSIAEAPALFRFEEQLALLTETEAPYRDHHLRELRNRLAHGEQADQAEIEKAIQELDRLISELRTRERPRARAKAVTGARPT